MIRIVNSAGRTLDPAPDQTITVERFNPLFNDADKLLQDKSYEFLAPFTDNNKAFFNMAHLPETRNTSYVMPAQFYCEGFLMVTGNIRYEIGAEGFICMLEPNISSLSDLIKNTRLTEMRGYDGDLSIPDEDAMETLMMDTCVNPGKYGFIYFPIQNEDMGYPPHKADKSYKHINAWDYGEQHFVARPPAGESVITFDYGQSPFFKVCYIIEKLAEFLGFKVDGDFFTDPEDTMICIYTRRSESLPGRFSWPAYMPNMTIAEFLKQLRERLHLIYDFNLSTQTLTVRRFKRLLESKEAIDLSPYITGQVRQEPSAGAGYTVFLKPDEYDKGYWIETSFGTVKPPLEKMIIGDGSQEIELACSTTNMIETENGFAIPMVRQACLNPNIFINGIPHDDINVPKEERSVDSGIQYSDLNDPTTLNNWPLRLVKYNGLVDISLIPGVEQLYPSASGMPLNGDDRQYFQFMADSKPVIVPVAIPPVILSGMKTTEKYFYRTAALNCIELIMEKSGYDAGLTTERLPAEIRARAIGFDENTTFTIERLVNEDELVDDYDPDRIPGRKIKAYWDEALHGIKKVELQVVRDVSDPEKQIFEDMTIVRPTTPKGTAGIAVELRQISGSSNIVHNNGPLEFRVFSGTPRILENWNGQQYAFTAGAGYYYASIPFEFHRMSEGLYQRNFIIIYY